MSTEKQAEAVLQFLSPRLREILRRVAEADRRDALQELAWLIEGYAKGKLQDAGDSLPATPRVSLNDLPNVKLVEQVRVRQVRPVVAEVDSPQPTEDSGE